MIVIDSQVHAWQQGDATGHHHRDPISTDVLAREMSMAGVDRVVIVPPLWDPSGNRYAIEAARKLPERFAVMGLVQTGDWQNADMAARIEALLAEPHVLGIEFLFNEPQRTAPYRDGLFDAIWPRLQENGTPVALLVPNNLDIAADLARRFPGLSITVDHLGVPRGASGAAAFSHLPQLLELAAFPNISVKAVGAGDYAPEGFPFGSIEEPLRRVVDAFGSSRVVWGSDLSRLRHDYKECVDHIRDARWLDTRDKILVLGGNASRIFKWPA